MNSTSQLYSAEYLAEDQSRQLINACIVLAVFETLFAGLYFASRYQNKKLFELSTYLMLPAFILCFSHIVLCFFMVKYGSGHHTNALSPNEMMKWLKLKLAGEFIYFLSIAVSKLSILCLYLQIFTTKSYRYATFGIVAIVVLTYITSLILGLTMCTPLAYNWNKNISAGHCNNLQVVYRWLTMPNLITDIAMLILPLPIIWRLQVSFSQQIGLTITFLTGSVGMITAILRFATFFATDKDRIWSSVKTLAWTNAEPSMYFIAACLPSLRPLFVCILRNINLRTHLRANYKIRWFSSRSDSKEIRFELNHIPEKSDAENGAGGRVQASNHYTNRWNRAGSFALFRRPAS